MPGVAWVGTAGIGVAAAAVEYIDEPALCPDGGAAAAGILPAVLGDGSRYLPQRPDSLPIPRWSTPTAVSPTCRN